MQAYLTPRSVAEPCLPWSYLLGSCLPGSCNESVLDVVRLKLEEM